MRSVKIKTKELLSVLKENKEQHLLDFAESMDGYVETAKAELAEMFQRVSSTGEVIRSIKAVEPRSYAESYETAIRMLEMSDDKVVELTQQEFSQYVEDKWAWKESFNTTNTMYKNSVN